MIETLEMDIFCRSIKINQYCCFIKNISKKIKNFLSCVGKNLKISLLASKAYMVPILPIFSETYLENVDCII
jgi:hypothetical protein